MKRLSIVISALMLVFGLTQCKKNLDIITPVEGVRITLDVDGGSKADVDPPHVNFVSGDVIYVGSNGKYVGTLTHNGSQFRGSISGATEGQPLYFYFLGNKTPSNINGESSGVLTPGTTTSLSVNITDQGNYPHLPVISMGVSNENYPSKTTTYTSKLYNKCSLMKFKVTTSSTAQICITGMNNKVTLDFSKPTETGTGLKDNETNNGFSYSKDGDGLIKMSAKDNDNVTWAIVLPQGELTDGEDYSAYTNNYQGARPAIHAIESNVFYNNDDINLNIDTETGMLLGEFTINSTGGIVHFSKGNLQATTSDLGTNWTWKFAENQYTCIGKAIANTTINGSGTLNSETPSTVTVAVDLFGWVGASYSESNNYGINNSQTPGDYGNISGEVLKDDWGNLAISNGGNTENSDWRTLTSAEWNYIGQTRPNASDKYGFATVRDIKGVDIEGVIILPDSFTDPMTNNGNSAFVGHAHESTGWSDNVYSFDNWVPMEARGAVFLPAAGLRSGTNVDYADNYGKIGYYWTSTSSDNDASNASALYFHGGTEWQYFDILEKFTSRCNGKAVRLVR